MRRSPRRPKRPPPSSTPSGVNCERAPASEPMSPRVFSARRRAEGRCIQQPRAGGVVSKVPADTSLESAEATSRRGLIGRWLYGVTGGAPVYPLLVLFGLNAVDELDRTAFGILL